jgi:hypothetical protein
MRPVETIPGMEQEGIKKSDRGDDSTFVPPIQ